MSTSLSTLPLHLSAQTRWMSPLGEMLLARTTPRDQVKKRSEGLSVFIVDMVAAKKAGMTIRPIRTMMNHSTTEVFFDNMKVPAENLIGEEGKGFKYILDGLNAERTLIAAECIGDGYWFIARATTGFSALQAQVNDWPPARAAAVGPSRPDAASEI